MFYLLFYRFNLDVRYHITPVYVPPAMAPYYKRRPLREGGITLLEKKEATIQCFQNGKLAYYLSNYTNFEWVLF